MAAGHASGPIKGTRQGCLQVMQTARIDTTITSGTATEVCYIAATEENPVMVRLTAKIVTPSDAATSHTLSVGQTGAGYTDILNAVDLTAAAGTQYVPSVSLRILTEDTIIYAISTVTGAITEALTYLLIELAELNSTIVEPLE